MKQLLAENAAFLQAAEPAAVTSFSARYCDMSQYRRVTIMISLDVSTGSDTGAVALTQATDTSGTSVKALGFEQMFANLDVGTNGSVLTETAVVSDTFLAGGAEKAMVYLIEVRAEDLDVANDFDHLSITIADITNGIASVVFIAREPRYGAQAKNMANAAL